MDDLDYTDTERNLMLIKEQIAVEEVDVQTQVHQTYWDLLDLVKSRGDAGILALALLCAEIDHGVAAV